MAAAWIRFADITEEFGNMLLIGRRQTKPDAWSLQLDSGRGKPHQARPGTAGAAGAAFSAIMDRVEDNKLRPFHLGKKNRNKYSGDGHRELGATTISALSPSGAVSNRTGSQEGVS
jgi:hypothetical protein